MLAQVLMQSQGSGRGNNSPSSLSLTPAIHSSPSSGPLLVSKPMETQEEQARKEPPTTQDYINIASTSGCKKE